MTYSAEQITFMLAEAIDKDKEYKSWHVSTKHLMTFVQMVIEKEALAQPEQEPVAWMVYTQEGQSAFVTDNPAQIHPSQRALPLYATPQRTWVGLTDEEIWETISRIGTSDSDVNPYAKLADARAIEAKLKEKNT